MADLNTNLNANRQIQSFEFQGKSFNFPIGVYWHLPKKLWITFALLGIALIIMMILLAIQGNWSFIMFGLFGIALSYAVVKITKKPRFVLYDDKMVFDEHGMTKPKILPYTHAKLYAYEHKHSSTGTIIHFVDFLYQENTGDITKIATINLEQARFDTHHFDKDDTLAFFEQLIAHQNKQHR